MWTYWDYGEPDDSDMHQFKDCVYISRKEETHTWHRWFTAYCDTHLPFMCEKTTGLFTITEHWCLNILSHYCKYNLAYNYNTLDVAIHWITVSRR